jgi:hypothetical protein
MSGLFRFRLAGYRQKDVRRRTFYEVAATGLV